jgi:membrane peptidoglycan carboxypeptidase
MKKIKKIILIFFIILMIIIASFLKSGYEYYKLVLQETSMDEMINSIRSQENFTKFEDLPENYINAVIAVEDRRFYIHPGIDPISIARAIGKDIISFKLVEGGSTITQQLAKNTYFTQSKSLTRKCAEIFMAFKYEQACTKEEIFELYVNTSYFGDGYYCVKDAANGYFDKDPIDMDLYECTLLAGVPNAPSVYAPTKNPELAMQRQAQVLKKMVKYKYLSQDKANEILNIRYDDYEE